MSSPISKHIVSISATTDTGEKIYLDPEQREFIRQEILRINEEVEPSLSGAHLKITEKGVFKEEAGKWKLVGKKVAQEAYGILAMAKSGEKEKIQVELTLPKPSASPKKIKAAQAKVIEETVVDVVSAALDIRTDPETGKKVAHNKKLQARLSRAGFKSLGELQRLDRSYSTLLRHLKPVEEAKRALDTDPTNPGLRQKLLRVEERQRDKIGKAWDEIKEWGGITRVKKLGMVCDQYFKDARELGEVEFALLDKMESLKDNLLAKNQFLNDLVDILKGKVTADMRSLKDIPGLKKHSKHFDFLEKYKRNVDSETRKLMILERELALNPDDVSVQRVLKSQMMQSKKKLDRAEVMFRAWDQGKRLQQLDQVCKNWAGVLANSIKEKVPENPDEYRRQIAVINAVDIRGDIEKRRAYVKGLYARMALPTEEDKKAIAPTAKKYMAHLTQFNGHVDRVRELYSHSDEKVPDSLEQEVVFSLVMEVASKLEAVHGEEGVVSIEEFDAVVEQLTNQVVAKNKGDLKKGAELQLRTKVRGAIADLRTKLIAYEEGFTVREVVVEGEALAISGEVKEAVSAIEKEHAELVKLSANLHKFRESRGVDVSTFEEFIEIEDLTSIDERLRQLATAFEKHYPGEVSDYLGEKVLAMEEATAKASIASALPIVNKGETVKACKPFFSKKTLVSGPKGKEEYVSLETIDKLDAAYDAYQKSMAPVEEAMRALKNDPHNLVVQKRFREIKKQQKGKVIAATKRLNKLGGITGVEGYASLVREHILDLEGEYGELKIAVSRTKKEEPGPVQKQLEAKERELIEAKGALDRLQKVERILRSRQEFMRELNATAKPAALSGDRGFVSKLSAIMTESKAQFEGIETYLAESRKELAKIEPLYEKITANPKNRAAAKALGEQLKKSEKHLATIEAHFERGVGRNLNKLQDECFAKANSLEDSIDRGEFQGKVLKEKKRQLEQLRRTNFKEVISKRKEKLKKLYANVYALTAQKKQAAVQILKQQDLQYLIDNKKLISKKSGLTEREVALFGGFLREYQKHLLSLDKAYLSLQQDPLNPARREALFTLHKDKEKEIKKLVRLIENWGGIAKFKKYQKVLAKVAGDQALARIAKTDIGAILDHGNRVLRGVNRFLSTKPESAFKTEL